MNQDKDFIKTVFRILNSPETSVLKNKDSAPKQWTINGEDYPLETITITDNLDDVIIRITENEETKTCIVDKCEFGNAVKLWYMEKMLNKRSKSGKFSRLITNINLINDILTKISGNDYYISVIHEVIPVFQQYYIKYNNDKYTTIVFNGSLTKITHNNIEYNIQSSGYIGFKLNLLKKELDRKKRVK